MNIETEKLTHYMVVGPGYYGKGKTLKEALANVCREGCRAHQVKIIYMGSADIGFSSDGYVSATVLLRVGEIEGTA